MNSAWETILRSLFMLDPMRKVTSISFMSLWFYFFYYLIVIFIIVLFVSMMLNIYAIPKTIVWMKIYLHVSLRNIKFISTFFILFFKKMQISHFFFLPLIESFEPCNSKWNIIPPRVRVFEKPSSNKILMECFLCSSK